MNPEQQILNELYNTLWSNNSKSSAKHNIFSNAEILPTLINDNEHVIDCGCGNNPFKNKIKNLIAFDPSSSSNGDYISTIEEFEPSRKFDVALCLGSIGFGNSELVDYQIAKVVSWLNQSARIFWRFNPTQPFHRYTYFNWSPELLEQYAIKHGFTTSMSIIDQNDNGPARYFAIWSREARPVDE